MDNRDNYRGSQRGSYDDYQGGRGDQRQGGGDRGNYSGRDGGYDRGNPSRNYDDRRGGNDPRHVEESFRNMSMHDNRGSQGHRGYDQRGDGRDDRRGNYDDGRGHQDDRRGYRDDSRGSQDSGRGYQNDRYDGQQGASRAQGYDSRGGQGFDRRGSRGGFGDRGRGGGGRGRGGRGRGGSRPEPVVPTAEQLLLEKKYREVQFAPRPNIESDEKKINLITNYVKVNIKGSFTLSEHRVEFYECRRTPSRNVEEKLEDKRAICRAFWLITADLHANRQRNSQINWPTNPYDLIFNGADTLWSKDTILVTRSRYNYDVDTGENTCVRMIIIATRMVELSPGADKQVQLCLTEALLTMRLRKEDSDLVIRDSGVFAKDRTKETTRKLNIKVDHEVLECWIGLVKVLNLTRGGLYLNVDMSPGIFYRLETMDGKRFLLPVIICTLVGEHYTNERIIETLSVIRNFGLAVHSRRRIGEYFKGAEIMRVDTRQVFIFDGLSENSASSSVFSHQGHTMTVAEYFAEKGMPLIYPDLPCVVQKSKKKIKILHPLELLLINDFGPQKGSAPNRFCEKMIKATSYKPNLRRRAIEMMTFDKREGCDENRYPALLPEDAANFDNFGISFNDKLINVEASLVTQPTFLFVGTEYQDKRRTGKWSLYDEEAKQFRKIIGDGSKDRPKLLPSVVIIRDPDQPYTSKTWSNLTIPEWMEQFADTTKPLVNLLRILENVGFDLPGKYGFLCVKNFHQLYDSNGALKERKNYAELNDAIFDIKEQSRRADSHATPIIFFLFSKTSKKANEAPFSDYAVVKHLCDIKHNIVNQCMLLENLFNITHAIEVALTGHNIVLKVLGKLGYAIREIKVNEENPCWALFGHEKERVLVLGIDVTHPNPNSRKNDHGAASVSVATIVGNVDTKFQQFRASHRVHMPGVEGLFQVRKQIEDRIKDYMNRNGFLPRRIVVYRDGCNEGDFGKYLYEEKKMILEAIDANGYADDARPTITYIVVTKRHHTRFFQDVDFDSNMTMADEIRQYRAEKGWTVDQRAQNALPGTVVEDKISRDEYYDYFMVSQAGTVGTSRPTHHFVLFDEWAPEIALFWPTISHHLSSFFARSFSPIAMPSPVQYAHLAANRAKDYLLGIEAFSGNTLHLADSGDVSAMEIAIEVHTSRPGMPFV